MLKVPRINMFVRIFFSAKSAIHISSNVTLTRSVRDSETSIDFVQGPPGSCRERVKNCFWRRYSKSTSMAYHSQICSRLAITGVNSTKCSDNLFVRAVFLPTCTALLMTMTGLIWQKRPNILCFYTTLYSDKRKQVTNHPNLRNLCFRLGFAYSTSNPS